jgi:hypothetical protein
LLKCAGLRQARTRRLPDCHRGVNLTARPPVGAEPCASRSLISEATAHPPYPASPLTGNSPAWVALRRTLVLERMFLVYHAPCRPAISLRNRLFPPHLESRIAKRESSQRLQPRRHEQQPHHPSLPRR